MAGSENSPFDRLPDDLILSVAQWLDPRALLRFGACARRMHGLPTEALWRSLCTARCEATPRFRLTPEREQWLLNHVQPDWVARYRFSLREILRTTITTEELQTFNWHFNFTPAGPCHTGSRALHQDSRRPAQLPAASVHAAHTIRGGGCGDRRRGQHFGWREQRRRQ